MNSQPRSLRNRVRPRVVLVAIVAIVVLIVLIFAVPRVLRLPGLVGSMRADLAYYRSLPSNPKGLLTPAALDDLTIHVGNTRTAVARLRSDWGGLLRAGRALAWLPRVGGDVAAAADLAELADSGLAAALDLLPAIRPALAAMSGDPPAGSLVALAQLPAPDEPALARATTALARLQAARARIHPERLSPRIQSLLDTLDPLLPLVSVVPDLLRHLPTLLGADGTRRYLILAQNSDELRATGGFISAVGLLALDRGAIESLTFSDSFSVVDLDQPHPLTPGALDVHMWAQMLLFRDANWWADFPTSARAAQQLYAQDARLPTDGVIAIDTQSLQIIVEALGPIQLPSIGETVTADRLTDFMHQYWAAPDSAPSRPETVGDKAAEDEWWDHRKDFMGLLASAIVDRLLSLDRVDPVKLARALSQMLEERHLLVYLPEAQTVLAERRWDGALVTTAGQYLMLVDSNVGFNKVNALLRQSIALTLTVSADGGAEAELRIRYEHTSTAHLDACVHEARYGDTYADMMDRCAWDYVRVLVPAGTLLTAREGLEDGGLAEPESGRAVFDGLLVLAPGETREVVFRFYLSPARLPETLYFQRQPGTAAHVLRVAIFARGHPAAIWTTDLSRDRVFGLP